MLISAFLIFLLYFMYLLCIYSSIYEMLKIKSKNSSQFTLSRAFCFLFFKNSFILLLNIISASYPVRRSKQISCKIPQFLHRQKLKRIYSIALFLSFVSVKNQSLFTDIRILSFRDFQQVI